MRKIVSAKLEAGRVITGRLGSDSTFGFTGCFKIHGPCGMELRIISSEGQLGWDHVSVSTDRRCPNWIEMCFVKDLFFDETETIVQYHPPKKDYINVHPYCLHLWRPLDAEIPMPPKEMIG